MYVRGKTVHVASERVWLQNLFGRGEQLINILSDIHVQPESSIFYLTELDLLQ